MPNNSFRSFMSEEGRKVVARWIFNIFGLVLVMWVWQPLRDFLVAIGDTPAALQTVVERVDALDQKVSRIAGETRVVQETPSSHYVIEPVYRGEEFILNLAIRRTPWGAQCQLLYRTALFADASNIIVAGNRVVPSRQINTDPQVVRVNLVAPKDLILGRTTVSLALVFDCAGTSVLENTAPVVFTLKERPPIQTEGR